MGGKRVAESVWVNGLVNAGAVSGPLASLPDNLIIYRMLDISVLSPAGE